MKPLLLGVLLLSSTHLFAQSIEWQHRYGGSQEDFFRAVYQTFDGGYIAVGYSSSTDGNITNHHGSNQKPDAWVVKMDAQGIIQWQRSYGGSNYDYGEDILLTPDGGYVFSGITWSEDGDVSHLVGTCCATWFVKLNATGDIEWENTFNE